MNAVARYTEDWVTGTTRTTETFNATNGIHDAGRYFLAESLTDERHRDTQSANIRSVATNISWLDFRQTTYESLQPSRKTQTWPTYATSPRGRLACVGATWLCGKAIRSAVISFSKSTK